MLPNVAMSRVYGWRGGCSAADVPDVGVGSVEWFGSVLTANRRKSTYQRQIESIGLAR
jgi:hypothetical protein